MKLRISDLWRWDGTVDRGPYALIGLLLFGLKHNIDRFVATLVFHRQWSLFNYWIPPTRAVRITSLARPDALMLGALLLLALPFIWIGVVLTLRRLRAIGLPIWLVVCFFLPVVNLVFFLVLSVVPTRLPGDRYDGRRPDGRLGGALDRLIPDNALGSAALAVLLTLPFELGAIAMCVKALGTYGWSLFVALPFCHGLAAVLIYGYHRPRSYGTCLGVSVLSIFILGVTLFGFAIEGIICLAMACPIAVTLACMGGSIGYLIQRRPGHRIEAPAMLMVLILFLPVLMGAEYAVPPETPLFEVRSSIEINAPPELVWKNVISFAELPPPNEWIFRTGIAYPIRARIAGTGAGAIRTCEFSTGPFIEPIEVWDEPRQLRFGVTSNPAPMQEWTLYSDIHPRHLNGFLVSQEGQFLLTPLPGGRTRLEGTTWYQHHLWPAEYWQLWSDAIIHRIHLRVLNHIKQLSEDRAPS
ncbi:MAG TPA: hypothetical protein VKV95_23810 [Terriglobia bacterium]|nr:hypothetical protein [Terriglobia bacterium]